MKHNSFFTKMVFALAFTAFVIGFSAFCQKQNGKGYSFRKEQPAQDNDTTSPSKRNRNGANRDLYKIDEQMKQLDIQMKSLDEQFKNLDMAKYQMEIDEAMKKIDVEKITEQIDRAMKDIDGEKINKDVAENAANVSRLRMDEVKKEMEQVKANLSKQKFDVKIDRQKMKADIEKALKNARQSLESAKEEIKNVKDFTDALAKDGLIDKSKAYKIEVKDDNLYINGKKQSKEISDKYRKYYKKSDFTIDMSEEDNFWI